MSHFKHTDTASYKEYFLENGFVVIENIIPPEEADYFYTMAKQVADNDFSAILNPDRLSFLLCQCLHLFQTKPNLSEKTECYDQLVHVADCFRKLAERKICLRILEGLKEREICLLMSQMLFKEAGSRYAKQAWSPHQDNSYPLNPNQQYITTNIF